MDILEHIPLLRGGKAAENGSAVVLGFFDGLHVGHISVIRNAARSGLPLCVLCAGKPHTAEKNGTVSPVRIIPESEELRILEELGADMLIRPPFARLRDMSGEEFIRDLVAGRLGASLVSCGSDFRFGKGASCGTRELEEFGKKYGFECVICPQVDVDGEKASSTRLLALLADGDIQAVNRLLGRCYGYTVPVVTGLHLARTLGAPTINQPLPADLCPIRKGVYASRTMLSGKWHYSVTNIGVKPTVTGGAVTQPISETWIPDFSGDLYGESIRVELVGFIRDERVFDSLDELCGAIHRDGRTARDIVAAACFTDGQGVV